MSPRFNPIASAAVPERADPAAANTCWEWIATVLRPLGLTVLVIESQGNAQADVWPHVGNLIGEKLQAANLGTWDAAKLGKNATHWYYHVSAERLGEAVRTAEAELAARGLLARVKIAYSDSEQQVWRVVYPNLPT